MKAEKQHTRSSDLHGLDLSATTKILLSILMSSQEKDENIYNLP